MPVQLLYKHDTYEDAVRTHDILDALWLHTNWPIIPPTNFTVLSHHYEDPVRKTDTLLHLQRTQKSPQSIGVLNTTVSFREARGRATIKTDTRQATGTAHKLEIAISMSLVGTKGKTLIEIETLREIDPFAIRPDYDTRPEVSEALRDTIATLVDYAEDWIDPGFELDLTGLPTLAALKRYGMQSKPRTDESSVDPIEAQLRAWHIAQHFNPQQDFDQMEILEAMPVGVCLNLEEPSYSFQKDDCILSINGKPFYSLHFLRFLLHESPSDKNITMKVQNPAGDKREISIQPQALLK